MLPAITLSKEQIDQLNWQELIADVEPKTDTIYMGIFGEQARLAYEAGRHDVSIFYSLLQFIWFFYIDVSRPDIFAPLTGNLSIENLEDSHLDCLLQIAPDVKDPELHARIADILWIRRKGRETVSLARAAVSSYIRAAITIESTSEAGYFDRINRAADLASQFGKRNNQPLLDVIAHIEAKIVHADTLPRLQARLMRLLRDKEQGDPEVYAPIAQQAATQLEAKHNWHTAREMWDILSKWQYDQGDELGSKLSRISSAKVYVHEAEAIVQGDKPKYGRAAHLLFVAISMIRSIDGQHPDLIQLRRQHLEYQRFSVGELQESEHEIDITAWVNRTQQMITGQDLLVALWRLGYLQAGIPNIVNLENEARAQIRNYPLLAIFSLVQMNEEGQIVDRRPSVSVADLNNPDQEVLNMEMFRGFSLHCNAFVAAVIRPAIEQIKREHHIRFEDIMQFVKDNPNIPTGREVIFARGIIAGLQGDFLVSSHLLIPQLEHLVRNLLKKQDVITTGLDNEGIQDEIDLGRLLYKEELEQCIGRELVFCLKGLLVARFGANFRNLLAHGLLDISNLQGAFSIYCWWLALHLCCKVFPVLK